MRWSTETSPPFQINTNIGLSLNNQWGSTLFGRTEQKCVKTMGGTALPLLLAPTPWIQHKNEHLSMSFQWLWLSAAACLRYFTTVLWLAFLSKLIQTQVRYGDRSGYENVPVSALLAKRSFRELRADYDRIIKGEQDTDRQKGYDTTR